MQLKSDILAMTCALRCCYTFVAAATILLIFYSNMVGYCGVSEQIISNNEITKKCNETGCEYSIIIEVEFYPFRKFDVFKSTNYEQTIILSKEKYDIGQKINIYCYRDVGSWTSEGYCDGIGHIDKRKEFFTQNYVLLIFIFPVLPTLLSGLWIIMSCLSKPMDAVASDGRGSIRKTHSLTN